MGDLNITRGQLLDMEWILPVKHEIAEEVHLGVENDSLIFEHEGQVVELVTNVTSEDMAFVPFNEDNWKMVYQTVDYDYLPEGTTMYTFEIFNDKGASLVKDVGTVTVHG